MAQDKIIVRGAWILSPLVLDLKSSTSKRIENVRHSKHGTPEDIF